MLSVINQQLIGQLLSIVSGAADEVMVVLKNDSLQNHDKKREIEKTLNLINDSNFDQLGSIGRLITDYQDGGDGEEEELVEVASPEEVVEEVSSSEVEVEVPEEEEEASLAEVEVEVPEEEEASSVEVVDEASPAEEVEAASLAEVVEEASPTEVVDAASPAEVVDAASPEKSKDWLKTVNTDAKPLDEVAKGMELQLGEW